LISDGAISGSRLPSPHFEETKMFPAKRSKPIEARKPQMVRGIATTRKPAKRQKSKRVDEQESVPSIIAQWQREKPEFDTGPMALFGALARAFLLTSPVIEKFMLKHGVARGMFDVLAALRRTGSPYRLPPSKLSKSLMLSGAGMTNRLDRLETLRLIVRQPEPNDRRSVRIQLTPKGLQLVEKLIPQLVEIEKQFVADYGDANVKKLTQLLIALNQKLVEKR
jgi:DNA-binding MarR family transcriptional regulator